MRKPQSQPALAALSEADREQLADWLRRDSYEAVLERVNQPRPEGLGLSISKKPLQTFYAKVALLDLINSRLPDDKKLTLAQFENLGSAAFNFEPSTSNRVADAHEAILDATHDLATSGDNTPNQLLALQRLADFPARADYRAHKIEMDLHRKHIASEKLEIAKRRLQLVETKAASKSENSQKQEDHLGPLPKNWEDVRERTRKAFNITPEESARRAELRRARKQPSTVVPATPPAEKAVQQASDGSTLPQPPPQTPAPCGPDIIDPDRTRRFNLNLQP